MKLFIVLMPLVFLISGTFSSSHPRPTREPSLMNGKITKLIDNLKNVVDYKEKQENHDETKIQRAVEDLKTAAEAISNKVNSFIICKRHSVPAQKSNIIKKMSVGKSLTFSFIMIIRRLLLFARLSYYFTEVWCRTGEK